MATDLLGTLYKSMSGLDSFTKGLNNLSNNVANLNTAGFKANDLFYRELEGNEQFGSSGDDGGIIPDGQGVTVGGSKIRFVEGELAETGNDSDFAISGNGFFILRDGEQEFYTRAGQFELDDEGYLFNPVNGYRLAKVEDGRLQDINIREQLISEAIASTEITLRGVLNKSATAGTRYPPVDAADADKLTVNVLDENGRNQAVELVFIKTNGSAWEVQVLDTSGSLLTDTFEVDFGSSGAATADTLTASIGFELYDRVDSDAVNERFNGVDEISLQVPGDLTELNDITLDISQGQLLTRGGGAFETISFSTGGQFFIDQDGYFVETATANRLGAVDTANNGVLIDAKVDITSFATITTALNLTGTLSAQAEAGTVYPPVTLDANGEEIQENPITVDIFDSQGNLQTLSLSFVLLSNDSNEVEYQLRFTDSQDNSFSASSTLRFLKFGTDQFSLISSNLSAEYTFPAEVGSGGQGETITFTINLSNDGNSLVAANAESSIDPVSQEGGRAAGKLSALRIDDNGQVQVNYSNGTSARGPRIIFVDRSDAPITDLSVDFSALGSADFANSEIEAPNVNGRASGQLSGFSVRDDGTIELQYSNEDVVEDGRIALALFSNEQALIRRGDALFTINDIGLRILGSGKDGAFGTVISGSIERSNVELSREFADIIIVQRGFQAASQVLNVTNELIEELYNSTKGGG